MSQDGAGQNSNGQGWVRCARCDQQVVVTADGTLERHDGPPGNLCGGSSRPVPKPPVERA
ncbi:hypothetical protein [Actinomadura kijaniata]|uniref:hypothetical protein n=1 Tax=Actinomadura kijaniata TaxID=46161 RepID=UPI000A62A211|nr:hypothetical protein [Actinomadura kijaniata]